MADESILGKFEELFGKKPERFSILEEQIDIKTQMNYFEESGKVKEAGNDLRGLLEQEDDLYNAEVELSVKKNLLVGLACVDDVEAYRIIERFTSFAKDELQNWAVLALQESRMTLESSLLNENQVFISTGLGGKGKKLRYFSVLSSAKDEDFTDLQRRLINKELEFALKKVGGEIEKNEFIENYATLIALVPLTISIKDIIESAINECNQIGDFVSSKFILTNVKVFTIDEIKQSWENISD
jgi:hypothetical protein